LENVLPLFEKSNTGVINASPLTLGLLTRKPLPAWHQATDAMKQTCRAAVEWCTSRGVDIAELGLQFALANPRIHSTLTGACTVEEVVRNVRAVGQLPDPELVAGVQAVLAPVRDQIWCSGRAEYN
jgi:aryl-alcohol dehydrogenase-like predicted oxidoreductase